MTVAGQPLKTTSGNTHLGTIVVDSIQDLSLATAGLLVNDSHGLIGTANLTGPIESAGNVTFVTSQTGSGSTFVMNDAPIIIDPDLGTPSLLIGTNISGTAPSLTAGHVTTNADLSGPIQSTGNITNVASQTGTGSVFVMNTDPTLITPHLGDATATTLDVNGSIALTGPLDVTGIATVTGSVTIDGPVPTLTCGGVTCTTITCTIIDATGLTTTGSVSIGGTLAAIGFFTADAGAKITGALQVTGVTTLDADLNAVNIGCGAITTSGAVSVGGTLQSVGLFTADLGAKVTGTLHVTGVTTLDADLNAVNIGCGAITTTGAVSVGGTLDVVGTSTMGVVSATTLESSGITKTNTINIAADAIVSGGLNVFSDSNFTGVVTTQGEMNVGGDLNVGGVMEVFDLVAEGIECEEISGLNADFTSIETGDIQVGNISALVIESGEISCGNLSAGVIECISLVSSSIESGVFFGLPL